MHNYFSILGAYSVNFCEEKFLSTSKYVLTEQQKHSQWKNLHRIGVLFNAQAINAITDEENLSRSLSFFSFDKLRIFINCW